jgi:hypothetical protein
MSALEDRRTLLCEQASPVVTGIDFVQVVDPARQDEIRIYFLLNPEDLVEPIVAAVDLPSVVGLADGAFLAGTSAAAKLWIRGESSGAAPVQIRRAHLDDPLYAGDPEIDIESAIFGRVRVGSFHRTVLTVKTRARGDFSQYVFTITKTRPSGPTPLSGKSWVDRAFNSVEFSFKQGCASESDCGGIAKVCEPTQASASVRVDYQARDFESLRLALLDFAAERYPHWVERTPADVGVMLSEVMAALGDEFSYIQDRYGREAFLETATQRRSLKHHGRLVGASLDEGAAATTYLALTCVGRGHAMAGRRVWAALDGDDPVPFEFGRGLRDSTPIDGTPPRKYWVNELWNSLTAHIFDAADTCLPKGSTSIWLANDLALASELEPGGDGGSSEGAIERFWLGRPVILEAARELGANRRFVHLVHITAVEFDEDPLALVPDGSDGLVPQRITRLSWSTAQSTPAAVELAELSILANVVPATAGARDEFIFSIRPRNGTPMSHLPVAVSRGGAMNPDTSRRPPVFRMALRLSERDGIGWLKRASETERAPELVVEELTSELESLSPRTYWGYRSSLLGSLPEQKHVTLENGSWRRIVAYDREGEEVVHSDYAGDRGLSLCFGDGEFGKIPHDDAFFRVIYRTGPATRANVSFDSIVLLNEPLRGRAPADVPQVVEPLVVAVRNPFAVTDGRDPESIERFKSLAPHAHRALSFRAVRDEDYALHASTVSGVQGSRGRARFTGSWLTQTVTPDPLGGYSVGTELRRRIERRLDAVRQVGRDVVVLDPTYVDVDLRVNVCLLQGHAFGHVREALRRAARRFFDPDAFGFGTSLRRAALEAVLQGVPGVKSVGEMSYRLRGRTGWRPFNRSDLNVSDREILRLLDLPQHPDRGSITFLIGSESRAAGNILG